MIDSLSFSKFGKTLEKSHPLPINNLIDVEKANLLVPEQSEVKARQGQPKIQIRQFLRVSDQFSSAFRSIPRDKRSKSPEVQEKSYEAKYSPKYDIIQRKMPTYSFRYVQGDSNRSKSTCSQDYYAMNYSSFNSGRNSIIFPPHKSNKVQTERVIKLQYTEPAKGKVQVPDFGKYTNRKSEKPRTLAFYDLLKVNYDRLFPRVNAGYVQFAKFQNYLKMRHERSETPPFVRLQYDVNKTNQLRSISIGDSSPRNIKYPQLRTKMAPLGFRIKQSQFNEDMKKWLEQNG
ncbi:hypothetical protein pb186bvf_000955 [Paramecium bursaria]